MTSQGSTHGRFTRAIAQKNLRGAEIAAKEMGGLSLLDALDYLVLGSWSFSPIGHLRQRSAGTGVSNLNPRC